VAAGLPSWEGGGGGEQRQWPQAYLHGREAVVGSSASDCRLTFMGGRRWWGAAPVAAGLP